MNRKALAILSLGHLTVDIGAGALPALLPFFQREYQVSYFWLAALVMTSGVVSSIGQLAFGIASDNLRTRFLLPIGVLCALSGYALVGVAPRYSVVFGLVALASIGSAMYHPEGTKSARTVSGRLPTTGTSVFAVGGNLGVALGPIIVTAIVAHTGLGGMAWLIIPAVAVAGIVATVVPFVTRAHEAHEAQARQNVDGPGSAKAMTLLVIITSLRSMVYSGVLTFVPLYAVNVLHQPVHRNGLLLFAFLGSGALANLAAGPIADTYGVRRTMCTSLAFVPLALALYLLSSGIVAWVGLALCGAVLIGTLSTTVIMGMQYMPTRLALASALLIGVSSGLGAIGVAALGRLADSVGLGIAVWALVGTAVLTFALTFSLPHVEAEEKLLTEGATAELGLAPEL